MCGCVNVIVQESLEALLNAWLGIKKIWPLELKGVRSHFSLEEVYFDILLYFQEEMTPLSFFFKHGCVEGLMIWVEKCLWHLIRQEKLSILGVFN